LETPRIPPALALFVLAPAIGELLSGSSPPTEFFNPIAFLFMVSLYGSGAIVVRELKIRWKKDFRALLLLGAAYGILEEGLLVKSFFDPNWVDLGILGSFGRWLDVNWVWTEMLIAYHAVFSITIPIVLVELAYPQRKNDRWTENRQFISFILLLFAVTTIGFLFITSYIPPLPQYVLAVLVMSLFVYAAYKVPVKNEGKETKTRKGRTLYLAGLAGSTAFFLIFWVGPYIFVSPIIVMTIGVTLVFGMLKFTNGFEWNASPPLDRLAIVAGALSFFIILAPFQESAAIAKGTATGMSLVGFAAIVGILLLKRRLKVNA
jgi:hypothetical protein